ncbi:MAG: 3-dehydroquinate synthase [Armatimonadota bacterium]|nr:3-dehydroquinate synthase [Armatimonadota bacterium]
MTAVKGHLLPSVILVGMPGSGKTHVGRLLAGRLGWTFVDTDALVEQRTGRSIQEIFSAQGEEAFRTAERAAVREAVRVRPAVIATGGGVLAERRNREALRNSGMLVYLRADPPILLDRISRDGVARPLLAGDPEGRLRALLAARAPLYEQADVIMDATRPPDELANALWEDLLGRCCARVPVDHSPRGYPVYIGAGVLDLVGGIVAGQGIRRATVLTHPRLWRRLGERVAQRLRGAGVEPVRVTVPPGERSKALALAARVVDRMAEAGMDRGDAVVALGGGVIGDLGGFVAGVYMRGVPLFHLPTTLLAQVDSAIGGKAAVNHPRAKNLIGVFHLPRAVLADVEVLRTLPLRELRSGLAEVIKYGMSVDAGILTFVEARLEALLAGDREALEECVRRCAAAKARVVSQDLYEAGERQILNYGHTVGHALERRWPEATHGEAVAVGMMVEAWVALRLGLVREEVMWRQEAILRRAGLPVHLPPAAPPGDELLQTMRLDKKVRRGEIRLTLLKDVGMGLVDQAVPEALLLEGLQACRASW